MTHLGFIFGFCHFDDVCVDLHWHENRSITRSQSYSSACCFRMKCPVCVYSSTSRSALYVSDHAGKEGLMKVSGLMDRQEIRRSSWALSYLGYDWITALLNESCCFLNYAEEHRHALQLWGGLVTFGTFRLWETLTDTVTSTGNINLEQ